MGKRQLSAEKRAAIISLHTAGHSMHQIAKQEHVSLGSVHYTVMRYVTTHSNKDRYRKGRPKVTSKSEDKYLVLTSKRDRFKTAPILTEEINQLRDEPVSVSTVKRRLQDAHLQDCIVVKKPLLRAVNKQKRLQ